MKNDYFITLLIIIISYGCKSAGNQGTVTQGKNGENIAGQIIVRCTPPIKTYSKEIQAKVTAEMDSLNSIPKSKLDVSLNTKVVQLAQYTSKGLDRDLIYFRICEMTNNRGFSPEETAKLIDNALKSFDEEVKKKSQN